MTQTLKTSENQISKFELSPPPAASPVMRSGASASALCRRRHDAPDALWSELSEPLHVRALASRPGASAAPPPDTGGKKREILQLGHIFQNI